MGGVFRPRTDEADWCRHIFREQNKVADTRATWLMDNGDSGPRAQWETPELCEKLQKARHVLVSSDVARRRCDLNAVAWVL